MLMGWMRMASIGGRESSWQVEVVTAVTPMGMEVNTDRELPVFERVSQLLEWVFVRGMRRGGRRRLTVKLERSSTRTSICVCVRRVTTPMVRSIILPKTRIMSRVPGSRPANARVLVIDDGSL